AAWSAADVAAANRDVGLALKLAPNDSTASLLWGMLQLLDGRPELALPAFDKAIQTVPSSANAHLLRARALSALGRTGEVGAEAERAAALATLEGDSVRACAALSLAAENALRTNDDARAMSLIRRAVAERPGDAWARAVLAAVDALTGRTEEARAEMAVFRHGWPAVTLADARSRPRPGPTFSKDNARLIEGLREAGLPEQ